MTTPLTTARRVPADLPERIQHYIGGRFVDSVDGDTFDVLDPVTKDRKSTRLNSSHSGESRMPSSA